MKLASFLKGRDKSVEHTEWIEKIHRWLPYLLGLYIFLNPFPATSPKEIIFYTMALLVVLILTCESKGFSFRSPMRVSFGLFILWSFAGLFFALDKVASANDFCAHLIKLVLLYYLLINYFGTKKRLETLSWLVIISGTIFAVAILFHWYVILGNPLATRLGLSYTNYATSINGFLTVFALILSIRRFSFEKKPVLKGFLSLSIGSLSAASILSQGRATLLALLVAVCIVNIRKIKTTVVTGILIVAFVMVMPVKNRFVSENEYSPRIGQVLYTYEVIKDHPVFGIGYSVDTFRDDSRIDRAKYMARLPEKYQQPAHPYWWPHNMFLSIAVRTGLPGGAIFLLFFMVPAAMCWKLIRWGGSEDARSWGLGGLALLAMFFIKGNLEPIFTSFVENIFFSILAMITIAWRLDGGGEPGQGNALLPGRK